MKDRSLLFNAWTHEDDVLSCSANIEEALRSHYKGHTPEEIANAEAREKQNRDRYADMCKHFERHQTWRQGPDPNDGRPKCMWLLSEYHMGTLEERMKEAYLEHGWYSDESMLVCGEATRQMLPELDYEDEDSVQEVETFMRGEMPLSQIAYWGGA